MCPSISSYPILSLFSSVDDGTAVIECFHRGPRLSDFPLKPKAGVGTAVAIVGKVVSKFGGKELDVNRIGL